MNKEDFIKALSDGLRSMPQEDVKRTLDFYCEMIADREEEGLPEEEAVASLGKIEDIVASTLSELPRQPSTAESNKKEKKKMSALTIILLILGAPIWLSLLVAAFSVVFSFYISVWSAVICLYAADVSFFGVALGSLILAIKGFVSGSVLPALFYLGITICGVGAGILMIFACNYAAKGTVLLGKLIFRGIKTIFCGKEKKG